MSSGRKKLGSNQKEEACSAALAVQDFLQSDAFQKVLDDQVQRRMAELQINERNATDEAAKQAAIDRQYQCTSVPRKVEDHQRLSGWKGWNRW